MLTVISSSALGIVRMRRQGTSSNLQYLKKVVGLFVCLGKKTQGESRDSIVAPRSKKGHEEGLAILDHVSRDLSEIDNSSYLCFEIPKSLSELSQLRCRDEIVVEVLHHDAGKLDVLFLLNTVRKSTIDPFCAKTDTKLADDQIASSLKQLSICRE